MGNARWNSNAYSSYSNSVSNKSREEIFTKSYLVDELDPRKINFRESVDSTANPESTPIVIASDVTGSMGILAEQLIKSGLGLVMDAIYKHKPVPDPHICCMAIGDGYIDRAPLQVTQFEASHDPLTKQMEQIYIEGGGGGNGGESYGLVYAFVNSKVRSDSFRRRNRKGFIFTVGDECCHPQISADQMLQVLGLGAEVDTDVMQILDKVQKEWHVFHLIVQPHAFQNPVASWKAMLNERAVLINNPEKLAQIIVTIISTVERQNIDDVISDFDSETAEEAREVSQKLLASGA